MPFQEIDFSKYDKTMVAGHVSDNAMQWLEKQGAIIRSELGIMVILLPKNANVCEGSTRWEYTIDFYHGDYEAHEWCEIELDIDAGSTYLKLVIEKEKTDGNDE